MTVAPAVFVSSNASRCRVALKPGNCSSGNPFTVALDQIGTMLSPCSPRIRAFTCFAGRRRRRAIRLRERAAGTQAAKASRVELCPQADDALPRQADALDREISQHVDRVADDDDI